MTTTAEALGGATERLRASGSETARLDAELLLGWAIGVDRTVPHLKTASGTRRCMHQFVAHSRTNLRNLIDCAHGA